MKSTTTDVGFKMNIDDGKLTCPETVYYISLISYTPPQTVDGFD